MPAMTAFRTRLPALRAVIAAALFSAAPIFAQLHTLSHAVQDSLAAKVKADSVQAHADSVKADSLGTRADTVQYSARRIRYRSDRFSLSDKALLTYRGSSLVADSIIYYNQDNLVEAMGAPLITDAGNPPILGYKMRYNLKTKVGEIYYGSSKKGNQTFDGVEVRRQKDGDILIARGDFSTCDLVDKHYFFYSRRMILEPKSKVLSGPIVMNVADVPVAILPMMVMPLGTGRRSGLLQPKFGGDQTQGFYLQGLGYYWAINDYTDLKMAGDVIEGAQGTFDKTNLNGEFRYNKRYDFNGFLRGTAYVSQFDVSNPGWSAEYANDWTITPDGKQTLKGSGQFVSEPKIIQDNALNETQAANQTANATLGYQRVFAWNNATINANLLQNYNLTSTQLDRSIPDLTFRVGAPLFPRSEDESPVVGDDPWYRKITYDYHNHFNVDQVKIPAPAGVAVGDSNIYAGYQDGFNLSAKYPLLQYFNITPALNLSQMWTATQRGDSLHPVRDDWDPARGESGEYFAAYNLSTTVDTRIYGIAQPDGKPWFGKLAGIRHTISPSVSYTFAPKIDSNPRFLPDPKIGGAAFQARQQTVGFSLGNDVDLKLAPDEAAGQPPPGQPGAPTSVPASSTGAPVAGSTNGGTTGSGPLTTGTKKGPKAESYKLLSAVSSANYNFARDTREWSPITSTFSLYLTKDVAFTLNTTHALYDDFDPARLDVLVSPILTSYSFGWRKGVSVGGNFNDGVRVKDTRGFATDRFDTSPWSMDLNYNFSFNSTRVGAGGSSDPLASALGGNGTFRRDRTHSASGSLKLNPTATWQMSYDTDYDFSQGRFSRHSFAFHRTLHCWVMDFSWTPEGLTQGWQFNIRITDLPDVKLETRDSRIRTPSSGLNP
ncbi:MAG: LPS-assembly protein LptD [Fibrobacteres bacterium]|nr:LPS-assembly protein LptD [Fibrobacterota bacterium]